MLYDLIVIGAGAGGLNVAVAMNTLGFRVLLIEKSAQNIGGDCLNYGCIPSKSLIHLSRLAYNCQKASSLGLEVTGKVDFSRVRAYLQEKQALIKKHENADYLKKQGLEIVLGEASFVGKQVVRVGEKTFSGKKIVLATGARPRKLRLPGVEKLREGQEYLGNESVFDLEKLPRKLLVIGGGPLGIELGQALNRLGSQVTILQRESGLLPKEDPAITSVLKKQLQAEGVRFIFNGNPREFSSKNSLIYQDKSGQKRSLEFEAVLVGIGRIINLPSGIEQADIQLDDQGKLLVNDRLQTTNPKVFALGDVAGGPMFTHATELQTRILLNNFFNPFKKKINYDNFAWVTYTDPEIATFGLSEKELQQRSLRYQKVQQAFAEIDRAITDDEKAGQLILLASPSGRLLGGSLISKNAGELIQELILANTAHLKLADLFKKVYPYPTAARVVRKATSRHLLKTSLTPLRKKLLRLLYH